TDANESMADIHNRMPVVLNKDELTLWLGSLEQSLNILKEKRPMLLKQLCG
ncbi:MAG TPA: SOS response-associated peptidase, partial [Lachnospiraceae bacterium]|nr:SOS response-associated peptidase [Lachnospiraceae bacterium]